MKWKKWLVWTLVACLTPVALMLVAQWTSPWWLDQGAVRDQVTRLIANVSGGAAKYDRIDIRIFPRPRAIVTGGSFSIPERIDVEARSVTAAIRLFPLFRGKVKPYEVRLIAPSVRLVLADTASAPAPGTPSRPFSVASLDTTVRAAVKRLAAAMPGLTLVVDSGSLEIALGGREPVRAEHLDVEADVSSDAIALAISFRSPRLEHFSARLRVSPADLAGDGSITITGAQLSRLAEITGAGNDWPVDSAAADAQIGIRLHGLSDATATVSVAAPLVAMHFGPGRIALSGVAIDAAVQTAGDSIAISVGRLAIASPALDASALLTRDRTRRLSLEARVGALDLATLQRVANDLAPGVSWLQGLPVTVTAGIASDLTLRSHAGDVGDLFSLSAMDIAGQVKGADLSITAFHDLPIRDANVSARLAGGVLTARDLSARAEGIPAHEGRVRLDLNPAVPPLSGSLTVDVDLGAALALAPRYLPKSALEQLKPLRRLHGSAVATVALSGTVNNVVPQVTVTDVHLAATDDRIPFPLRLSDGTVTYTGKGIAGNGLSGALGASSFTGIAARLTLTGRSTVTATAGTIVLALPELLRYARTQRDLAKSLDSVASVAGAVVLSVQQLALPLDSLKRVTFAATATPRELVVVAPHYGPSVRLDGGVIRVTERWVEASGVVASALDARLTIGGRVDDYLTRIDSASASVKGTIGLDALAWGYERGRVPATLMLRGALDVGRLTGAWHRDGVQRAAGVLTVSGGPTIDLALRLKGEMLEVERMRLHDGASDATFSGSVEGAHFRAGCGGHLAGTSIDHIFATAPLRLGKLDCAFQAAGDLKKPKATTATGTLIADGLALPRSLPVPVSVDSVSLVANDSSLEIRTLRVSSGASRVDVKGSVRDRDDKFFVDADITGDSVIVPILAVDSASAAKVESKTPAPGPASRESAAAQQSKFYRSLREIPATGVVRVHIGLVRVLHFEVAPLVATATIEGAQASLALRNASLCGVGLSGGLTLRPDSVDLSLSMTAKNIPVERTIICLTDQRLDITGSASIAGQFAASAPMGQVRDRIRGTLAMTLKKGRINKFDALANALKVINSTQVLVGQASDIGTKGMAYSEAKVQLDLQGLRVDVKEFSLDASGFEAAAHGQVDFVTRKLDLDALIAPIKTANWVISHIPIIRNIFGGSVLAIPVKIGGTIEKPVVVPLGVEAVGSRLIGILGNTLKLPATLVTPAKKDSGVVAPDTAKGAAKPPG